MEFGMGTHQGAPGQQQQQVNMEWYTPSAGSTYQNYQGYQGYQAGNSYTAPSGNTFVGGNNFSGGNSFDDEPPLLEELGIDIPGILRKTRAVLLHRVNNKALEDLDMGGALIFITVLAGLHLLMGKLHFGVILGWSVVHSIVLWFLINQLAGPDRADGKGLELYNICCLIGYCLAPLVVFSGLALMIPRGPVAAILALMCTVWSADTAARITVRKTPHLEDLQYIIMLPCLLTYGAFAMLALY